MDETSLKALGRKALQKLAKVSGFDALHNRSSPTSAPSGQRGQSELKVERDYQTAHRETAF